MSERYGVPPPVPPDAGEAWYAPDVRAQRAVHPGVVVTVRETGDAFAYEAREPTLLSRNSLVTGLGCRRRSRVR